MGTKALNKPKSMPLSPMVNHMVRWWTRRVDAAPYQVIGPLQRFDERDTMFSRAALQPDSEDYKSYYAAHPELEKMDRRLRRYPDRESQNAKWAAMHRKHPFALSLSLGQDLVRHLLSLVDGPVNPKQIEVEPKLASKNIKAVARYLGADLVGICELNPAWVYSFRGRGDARGEPARLTHRFAITLVLAQDFDLVLTARGFSVAHMIETQQLNFIQLGIAALRLATYIRGLGYPARAHPATPEVQMLQVPVAVDAGLGEVGRQGLLVTRRFGPAVRLATVTTDLPLEVDKPVDLGVQDFCTQCKKCAVVCPTGAVPFGDREVTRGVKLWSVDHVRCARLHWATAHHVCARCVTDCPWTKPRNIIHRTVAELAVHLPLTRRPLIWLDDILYGRKPQAHPYPSWLEIDRQASLKQRIVTLLHKV